MGCAPQAPPLDHDAANDHALDFNKKIAGGQTHQPLHDFVIKRGTFRELGTKHYFVSYPITA
jgi:hypothetical protein